VVIGVAKSLGVNCSVMSRSDADRLRNDILAKFTRNGHEPIWTDLNPCVVAADPDGSIQSTINDLLDGCPAVLLFDKDDDDVALRFSSASQLQLALVNCHPFVFYISNDAADYLIARDDHDNIYALDRNKVAPQAEHWLRDAKARHGDPKST